MSQDTETYTYRGRSLEELVPRIRQELGDDAVIVGRRETTSGGVGGFFAKREIEVEVRPGESWQGAASARAFAQQLAQAQERQHEAPAAVPPAALQPQPPAVQPPAVQPAPPMTTSPEVDALPTSADVTVDDLFPSTTPQAQGLAALFNAGVPTGPIAPEVPIEEDEPVSFAAAPQPELQQPPAQPEPAPAEQQQPPAAAASPEPIAHVEQPTGAFDYLAAGPEPAPAAVPEPQPFAAAPAVPEPQPFAVPEPPAPAAEAEPAQPAAAPEPGAPEPGAAHAVAEGLTGRGVRADLAQAVAEEAVFGLLPLLPDADPRSLVVEALARRIPVHPLRRGPGVVGFVGPGGAGKTRCAARLAAAHARHGTLPVTVVSLRSPDGGAEMTRLLAPYGVTLHAVESGAEGAARIAEARTEGLVVVDTPGVSPRSAGELRALSSELQALAPDELHLAIPATMGSDAARELVRGVESLGTGALALTHTDETEQLGTVVGLAIDCRLPLSFLARGQAVDAGLRPVLAAELASELVP